MEREQLAPRRRSRGDVLAAAGDQLPASDERQVESGTYECPVHDPDPGPDLSKAAPRQGAPAKGPPASQPSCIT